MIYIPVSNLPNLPGYNTLFILVYPSIAVEYRDLERSSTNHFWKSMHFHLLTYALKTSSPHCKYWPRLLNCFLHHSNYRNGISEKVGWLKIVNTTDVWTAWARYHSQRSNHLTKPDISAILPLTDAPVNTQDTKYHYIEIVEKKTQLLYFGKLNLLVWISCLDLVSKWYRQKFC